MIRNIVEAVRGFLPESEQMKLRLEAGSSAQSGSSAGTDGLDAELKQLYRHLLSKPPAEVDDLINKAFQVNGNVGANPTPVIANNTPVRAPVAASPMIMNQVH